MNDPSLCPLLQVDLDAIAANTRQLSALTTAGLLAVVKADAFGHGVTEVARTALDHGAAFLGTATLQEALAVRERGIDAPLLCWLTGPFTDFGPALRARVDVAAPTVQHLDAVAAAARATGRRARVHLHADVGMARDGAPAELWGVLCRHAARLERVGLIKTAGVMGHLGCADDPADPHTGDGLTRFRRAVAQARRAGLRPAYRHLAATAALMTSPDTHQNLVRIGAGLYGIGPGGTGVPLRPATTLTAPVTTVRDVPARTPVGYHHGHITDRPTRLALLPLGYGDGLPRAAQGRAQVLVQGRLRPVVGEFSMDQIVIDVGDAGIEPGESVTLLGPGLRGEPTLGDWAAWAHTLPHEICTALGRAARIERRHLPAQARPVHQLEIPA
ncbi:alanine racemase [Streptomyces sp. NPDC050617]|uniref:alanine racemase n=1 Tax=Streptomyces sp. NPDC050617 TaxID=3154628 RepID=UPI00343EB84E